MLDGNAHLPHLKLTLHEAVGHFVAARLVDRYQDWHDRDTVSAFQKLASIVPPAMSRAVHATAVSLNDRPGNAARTHTSHRLAEAWADGRKVRFWYQSALGKQGHEHLVSPYLIEPYPAGHTRYLIGHDAYADDVRTFKVERIHRVAMTNETFVVPENFTAATWFQSAWGIWDDGKHVQEVQLRFHDRAAAERVSETRWHHSQTEERRRDGTLDLTFRVGSLTTGARVEATGSLRR